MIANIIKGKNFRSTLHYHEKKISAGKASLLSSTFSSPEARYIMKELNYVRLLRPDFVHYLFHASISFPRSDQVDDEAMNVIATEFLAEMGFTRHQYLIFRHHDTDHPHLHIMAHITGYDGTVVPLGNDYLRTEQALRKLEKKYCLTESMPARQATERAPTKKELDRMMRTGEPSLKLKLQAIIKAVIEQKPNTTQFIKLLEAKGINILFHQPDKVNGISFGYKGISFKGQHLGHGYKWPLIKTNIDFEQGRDQRAINEANLSTRINRVKREQPAVITEKKLIEEAPRRKKRKGLRR